MIRRTKDSTVIAELMRQALDLMLYKLGDRPLAKSEILGVVAINHKVILRGETNLSLRGWAVYSGTCGDWQCELNHNRFLRGTPRIVALSAGTMGMFASLPETHGLYRIRSAGMGWRAEEIEAAA